MPFERDTHRIVIAGASSLLGAELKSLLEESRFGAADFRLLDEELAAGTLTEAGGEPAVIQPVEADSFDRARFVFFAGSSDFTLASLGLARRSGAAIIDLSGHAASLSDSVPWFPGLEKLRSQPVPETPRLATIPSAPAEALIRLTLSLRDLGLRFLAATVQQPVSAWGKLGIEELETQTSHLLSLKPPGTQLFDAQVAFNTLMGFGPSSRFDLRKALEILRTEVHSCLRGNPVLPAMELVHVPVFYGTTFFVCVELDPAADVDRLRGTCKDAGFSMIVPPDSPNNVNVAEESAIYLALAVPDPAKPGTWWFWGAVDNIRLQAWNAVKLAEKLAE